jgi:hypothetical protein
MQPGTESPDLSFLAGATVTRVYLDQYAAGVLLDLGPPGGIYDWGVERPFHLRSRDRSHELDPESTSSMLPFLSTLGATVEKAEVNLDGTIRFDLSGGISVECASGPRYEAWQLVGPKGFLLVCLPGGGLATFGGRGKAKRSR